MKILDEETLPWENLAFSLKRYWYWWIILIVTMIFDYLSTTVFVSRYGIHSEGNLTTKFIMENLGPNLGNFIGKLLQLLSVVCLVCLSRRLGNFFLLFVVLINCWAIVVNSLS